MEPLCFPVQQPVSLPGRHAFTQVCKHPCTVCLKLFRRILNFCLNEYSVSAQVLYIIVVQVWWPDRCHLVKLLSGAGNDHCRQIKCVRGVWESHKVLLCKWQMKSASPSRHKYTAPYALLRQSLGCVLCDCQMFCVHMKGSTPLCLLKAPERQDEMERVRSRGHENMAISSSEWRESRTHGWGSRL